MTRSGRRAVIPTLAFAVMVLCVTAAISHFGDIRMFRLIGDPTAVANMNPLTGMLSSLGILLWCTAAAISIFTAITLNQWKPGQRQSRFLLASGLVSAMLGLDDLFQFHEDLGDRYLGLPQLGILGAIALTFLAYLVVFRKTLPRTNWRYLVLACVFFALSMTVDLPLKELVRSIVGDWRSFVEESFKWIGLAFWFLYHTTTAYRMHREAHPLATDQA